MGLRFGARGPFDGFPDNAEDFFLIQSTATLGVSNAAPTPVAVPAEAIQAESAQDGPGGPGSVVAETSGGLTINLIFDAAAMAAPASFRNGIEQAAAIRSATITDKITVNLNVDYSGTGGGAAAGPDSGQWVSYSTVRADLVNNASAGDTTFNALPTWSTIQGQSNVAVWNAQLKLWGLLGANDTTTDDGSGTFATDIIQPCWSASRCMNSLMRWGASRTDHSQTFSIFTDSLVRACDCSRTAAPPRPHIFL
jgi:serralysin